MVLTHLSCVQLTRTKGGSPASVILLTDRFCQCGRGSCERSLVIDEFKWEEPRLIVMEEVAQETPV